MTIEVFQNFLAWSAAINYGLLIIWFLIFFIAHDWLFKLHSKWFILSKECFDAVHYSSMAGYKLLIFIFNLAPYLALRIIT